MAAPAGLFPVKEGDGILLRVGKQTINVTHMVFTAIVGAVMWFITVVAG